MQTAIGRSKPEPILRISAGARFTVICRTGKKFPGLVMAAPPLIGPQTIPCEYLAFLIARQRQGSRGKIFGR